MQINGLDVPSEYVAFAARYRDAQGFCNLRLKPERDSFASVLQTELAQIYTDAPELTVRTAKLGVCFVADGCYGQPGSVSAEPGAMADIVDFTEIICFGMAGDGSPFCFDYRGARGAPSVILWDDDYWRKISNSFEDFLLLFS
ncbi:SMI1/KNR4 family protein [Janthinobacterium sp. LB2P70]|uniref:SMI1/KNR4 family protein n=1 Tax=Janthinobacterium sp. LB2P70 TaxID=3424197 RepID=UPI003F267912